MISLPQHAETHLTSWNRMTPRRAPFGLLPGDFSKSVIMLPWKYRRTASEWACSLESDRQRDGRGTRAHGLARIGCRRRLSRRISRLVSWEGSLAIPAAARAPERREEFDQRPQLSAPGGQPRPDIAGLRIGSSWRRGATRKGIKWHLQARPRLTRLDGVYSRKRNLPRYRSGHHSGAPRHRATLE